MKHAKNQAIEVLDKDLTIQWFSGNIGAGGQHRNKHANSARVIHNPTGIVAISQGRDRQANLRDAKQSLYEKLNSKHASSLRASRGQEIKQKMGSGERGDKIRTYRFQDNRVKNHLNNKETSTDKVLMGKIDLLWD